MTTTIDPVEVEPGTFYWAKTTSGPRRYLGPIERLVIKVAGHGDSWLTLYPIHPEYEGEADTQIGWEINDALVAECPQVAPYRHNHRAWWSYGVELLRPAETRDRPTDTDGLLIDELSRQVADLSKQVRDLIETLRQEKERGDANFHALEDFKALVVEVGGVAAEENDWCATYDTIMEELGLPRRKREFEVVMDCRFKTSLTVVAADQEEAEQLAAEVNTRYGWNPVSIFDQQMGRPYDLSASVYEPEY